MEEVDEFDTTVNWAIEEEKTRLTRGQGISSFYLIVLSLIIIFICVMIFWFTKVKEETISALSMMQNSEYIYDDEYSNGENFEE